jgi:hypothetical protein
MTRKGNVSQSTTDRPPRAAISRRKKSIFILMSVALPLIGLACLEGALRIGGMGGYPATFKVVGPVSGGTLIVTDTNGAASYFYSSKSRAGAMFENSLVTPKPAGTVRILLCGESAMKGFPQPRALACTSFLQAMLEECWPDRHVEVINIATTAIASFPVLDMLREGIHYQPDLVIVYCGNNEFFGAYGVASLHSAGGTPWAIQMQRRLRSIAIVQLLEKFTSVSHASEDKTLMEVMMGKASIAADDPLRGAAARNLYTHTLEMIRLCLARNVPIIVSTLAFNERDLAPLGTDDLSGLDDKSQMMFTMNYEMGAGLRRGATAEASLKSALKLYPAHAGAHYALGRLNYEQGNFSAATAEFQVSADLDPMPWRPPSICEKAIRDAAREGGAVLCDMQKSFREASPGGCIGWELMDDHVHPSLQGQALMARAWVQCLTRFSGDLAVAPDRFAALPDWKTFAARLGNNEYEEYGVAHTLRVLCDVPFIRKSNPGAFERYDSLCRTAERRWPSSVVDAAHEWQKPQSHSGGIQRPISAMVGRAVLAGQDAKSAESLYEVAARSVPLYSSLHLEYVYFMLAARERTQHGLRDADKALAADEIERAKVLLAHGRSESGLPERYIGRLYQLRREFGEAIPWLLAARAKLTGKERLAADQALVVSYVQTNQQNAAREFLTKQINPGEPLAAIYQQLLKQVQEPFLRGPNQGP